ncbi:Aste57867_15317 [Aphanomyces stellatus]|uniref:Aste57867_15317 protein n=1 Tax=Aphanomyces stellatus TaxID=120398 RepID=A0A485L2W5_9STRA|nr:hypothetical protein As57867_015261 [Aphanomyces stellatus]VFT92126.1 Aste57867_15317 [Aphanomyces stellatus]
MATPGDWTNPKALKLQWQEDACAAIPQSHWCKDSDFVLADVDKKVDMASAVAHGQDATKWLPEGPQEAFVVAGRVFTYRFMYKTRDALRSEGLVFHLPGLAPPLTDKATPTTDEPAAKRHKPAELVHHSDKARDNLTKEDLTLLLKKEPVSRVVDLTYDDDEMSDSFDVSSTNTTLGTDYVRVLDMLTKRGMAENITVIPAEDQLEWLRYMLCGDNRIARPSTHDRPVYHV